MSCPRVEWRVNLCFNIALGSPCELTQLAFPALSLLSWHITVVQQLGCSWSSCGELYSQSAEFPFQLSALKCVQNVQLFRHHSGPLAPLWDQDANADKVAEWEKLCFKAENCKSQNCSLLLFGNSTACWCCSLHSNIVFKGITQFLTKWFAPVMKSQPKRQSFLKMILIRFSQTHRICDVNVETVAGLVTVLLNFLHL